MAAVVVLPGGTKENYENLSQNIRLTGEVSYLGPRNVKKVKVKVSRYTPWRRLGGEEV
jgi:hypothetical protein